MSTARFATLSEGEIRSAERTLMAGTWAITFGAMLFSVLTVTPLVLSVTPHGWEWTAPILALVVDSAVIIVVRLDAVIVRLGGEGGAWPLILRWMTGIMTLALNVGNSALHRDWVGVAVHSVAPLLLIVTAEAGLAYRRAISTALARISNEQAEAAERERQAREAQAKRLREEQEKANAAQEQAEREAREHALRLEKEKAEQEEARLRSEREHQLALEQERTRREEQQARLRLEEEAAARDHALLVERERAQRELAERRRIEDREERERREKQALEAAAGRQLAGVSPAQARPQPTVTARVTAKPSKTVEPVVMSQEFAGMTQSEAEQALFKLYKEARDANTAENWKRDNPLFQPGGAFCGSNLGRRLGRSDAAGRTNVMPKFEEWYDAQTAAQTEKSRELLGVG
ncbi:DUF2637 domain-containing protein [Streptomyces sp. WAC05292]|uniref:MAP7 domain-containing protein n=1 Tax=Streptomyces sp. WAC05292 TaxID=2487418 RepID=UPI000F73594D|nr:MAP7 domain-containing protein [Streptomyces sp. WAC05292]RSS95058.1 DUF2637 domain-containing protein [Streptomyces sp. WAC05292]